MKNKKEIERLVKASRFALKNLDEIALNYVPISHVTSIPGCMEDLKSAINTMEEKLKKPKTQRSNRVFHVFSNTTTDKEVFSNGEVRRIECIIGCNGEEHAMEIEEVFYMNNEVYHANFISSFSIGRCTCHSKTTGGFILNDDI